MVEPLNFRFKMLQQFLMCPKIQDCYVVLQKKN